MTNKINQATKYDGGIGDNKQDKPSNQVWRWHWWYKQAQPNNQIWRRNWWCGITFLSSSYSISTKLSRHLHVYATEPDERVLVCGCCGIVCKTGFSFPSSVQLWDWMHCGITNGTATKNNQRVWSCLLWNNQRVWFACCEITFSSASCWDNGAWRERLLLDWFGWCWRCFTNLADNEICIFMALVKKRFRLYHWQSSETKPTLPTVVWMILAVYMNILIVAAGKWMLTELWINTLFTRVCD